MFTRKLVVILVPLLLAAALCWIFPLLGGVMALLLPLSGAGKRKEPFGHLLWVPALLLALTVGYQYGAAAFGWRVPMLSLLATQNGQVVLVECAFVGYMTVTCLRTRR